jgi:hypothetical protein
VSTFPGLAAADAQGTVNVCRPRQSRRDGCFAAGGAARLCTATRFRASLLTVTAALATRERLSATIPIVGAIGAPERS